ncbi:hypothetical protein RRG08_048051 [Elysia crispata]|uniref:Secreted protein n=1 Tax=Elysia crispata TaxID=231223 RepID=A0AAE1D8Z6_9GAST|nr:hypothetical protein RRG08_048051 [Elysia crispata]
MHLVKSASSSLITAILAALMSTCGPESLGVGEQLKSVPRLKAELWSRNLDHGSAPGMLAAWSSLMDQAMVEKPRSWLCSRHVSSLEPKTVSYRCKQADSDRVVVATAMIVNTFKEKWRSYRMKLPFT